MYTARLLVRRMEKSQGSLSHSIVQDTGHRAKQRSNDLATRNSRIESISVCIVINPR